MGCAALLRSSELLSIRRSDLKFNSTYLNLCIENNKTDVYRDGSWVSNVETRSKLCPVFILGKYLEWAKIRNDSDEFIFRNVTKNLKSI